MNLADIANITFEDTNLMLIMLIFGFSFLGIIQVLSKISVLDLLRISSILLFSAAAGGAYIAHEYEGDADLNLVLDTSESMSISDGSAKNPRYVDQNSIVASIVSQLRDEDKITIITYDSNSNIVVRRISKDDFNLNLTADDLGGSSNISKPLELISSKITSKEFLVLFSDGQTTDNSYLSLIESLSTKNISISTLGIGSSNIYNYGIDTISIPKKVLLGQTHQISMLITNEGEEKNVSINLTVNGVVVNQTYKLLDDGINQVSFPISSNVEGKLFCEINIESDEDDLIKYRDIQKWSCFSRLD